MTKKKTRCRRLACFRTTPVKLLISALVVFSGVYIHFSTHPDHFLDTPDFIKKYGYVPESHVIETEDGYHLTIHRIRHSETESQTRPVVFLQHGFYCSSDTWVYKGPDQDLAFILADAGFDVWLGNSRGSHYSIGHKEISTTNETFWDFSIHELGYYDLPAAIDYILQQTKQKDLFYIGHSMGTTIMYILGATRPEYNSKIRAAVTMTPLTIFQGPHTVGQSLLVRATFYLNSLLRMFGVYVVYPRTLVRSRFMSLVCKTPLCTWSTHALFGHSTSTLNETVYSVAYTHIPAGSAMKVMEHFLQAAETGKFGNYNYGTAENIRRYNQPNPPGYDLKKVDIPISIYYGGKDSLIPQMTVDKVRESLPNVVEVQKIDSFHHFDFLWSPEAAHLVYKPTRKFLQSRLTTEERSQLSKTVKNRR